MRDVGKLIMISAPMLVLWLLVGAAHLGNVVAFIQITAFGPRRWTGGSSSNTALKAQYSPIIYNGDLIIAPDVTENRALVMKIAKTAFLFADTDYSSDLNYNEVHELMLRMTKKKEGRAAETAKDMFDYFNLNGACASVSFELFQTYLFQLDENSPLFKSLLIFAEDVFSKGVSDKLSGGAREDIRKSSQGSHILDDGSQAWRDSVEAAFDLCDLTDDGDICKLELIEAGAKYPLIGQLMRVPVDLNEKESRDYLMALFEEIDDDQSDSVDREEWTSYFCASRDSVPRPDQWDKDNPECQKITGFIFDCDGTIYNPTGLIEGAEEMLTWIEQSGFQYALLSNTGSKSYTTLQRKLSTPGERIECRPNGKPFPTGQCYTAADAQVDFLTSGHMPEGSKLLVLAPESSCWKRILGQRDRDLLESWDIRSNMDIDASKEWAQFAMARVDWENLSNEDKLNVEPPPKVAVVFFHDGEVAADWSFQLFSAMTILVRFGAEFIYTAEDATNPSIDERYPGVDFPIPGPGMFVNLLKTSMLEQARCYCCGKGGNAGRRYMMDRAIQMLIEQGHSGKRDEIMIVGDRFDTDIRAGTFAGIKSCLLESGAHTLDNADQFPTDIPSFAADSIIALPYPCPKRTETASRPRKRDAVKRLVRRAIGMPPKEMDVVEEESSSEEPLFVE